MIEIIKKNLIACLFVSNFVFAGFGQKKCCDENVEMVDRVVVQKKVEKKPEKSLIVRETLSDKACGFVFRTVVKIISIYNGEDPEMKIQIGLI